MTSSFASELLQRAEYEFLTNPTLNDLKANMNGNRVTSKNHKPFPSLSEIKLTPKRMIFCCFDRRVNPEEFLGLKREDETILVRTASGTPARNIIDIVAIDNLVGLTELTVVKHTDCGALHMTENDIHNHIISYNPDLAGKLDDFSVGTTTDIVQKTREDVKLLKSSPLIRKELRDTVSGLLYDIKTGKVTKIV
ncbi:carbonic anhydrase [Xylariaceae sp. AK1471]|nr:carbonic anhydrase [Xylariaceae sp. AK1471]